MQLGDPFEGYLPRSHVEAFSAMFENNFFGPMAALRSAFQAESAEHARALGEIMVAVRDKISFERIRNKFGVNCWHTNNVESDAVWKLNSALGSGVATESNVERLRDVLTPTSGISVDGVRYEDFDPCPISY
jgi:hypothetical protein